MFFLNELFPTFYRGHSGNAGPLYGDLEASLKLESGWRMHVSGMPCMFHASGHYLISFFLDALIKRLFQRHIYLGIDAIADRNLSLAIAHQTMDCSSIVIPAMVAVALLSSATKWKRKLLEQWTLQHHPHRWQRWASSGRLPLLLRGLAVEGRREGLLPSSEQTPAIAGRASGVPSSAK